MNENVYKIDKNGAYVPIGLNCDYLPDGVWYVRHHEGCNSISSVKYLEGIFKLASRDDFEDIKQLCSMQDYTDYILDSQEFRDLMNNQKGYTLNELVSLCVSLVFRKNSDKKYKRKRK